MLKSSCFVNWRVSDMVVTHVLSLCSLRRNDMKKLSRDREELKTLQRSEERRVGKECLL